MRCPLCKEEIADGAMKCKHCKSMLAYDQSMNSTPARNMTPIWSSITSMVLGIISTLTNLEYDWIDEDTAFGILFIGILAIIFGLISLNSRHRGRGMAIAGVITGIIGILFSIEWI
jgi:ABC-type Mn2+/Zn2+ transport system permease subunit